MKPATTRSLLVLGLLGTLALIWLAPSDDDGVSGPTAEKTKRGRKATAERSKQVQATGAPAASASTAVGQLGNPERAPQAENIPDLFKALSWYVPPPPPPALPPPPPSAPPLPFGYVGQYIDGDTKLIILTRGDRMINVSVGDVIDRIYQVQSLRGGQLTFLYLPLKTEQSLNTGVAQ